jgi:hypothetical protein
MMFKTQITKSILAVTMTTLSLLIAGCATPQQAFEPKYNGGYPTKETAKVMFEEYDYQAAVQFYVWGYAYWIEISTANENGQTIPTI